MKPAGRRDAMTGILLLAGAGLLVPGLVLPVVTVEQFWVFETEKSVTGAVGSLLDGDNVILGIVVLVFSIVLPVGKLALSLWIWWMSAARPGVASRLLAWNVRLGRWSMLDVLLVAIVVAVLSLDAVARISAGSGAFFFCAAVIATMAGTHRLERRS